MVAHRAGPLSLSEEIISRMTTLDEASSTPGCHDEESTASFESHGRGVGLFAGPAATDIRAGDFFEELIGPANLFALITEPPLGLKLAA